MRLFLVLLCLPGLALAKPLITSSEESLSKLCLDASDTAERVARFCEEALKEDGATSETRADFHTNRGDALAWLERYEEAEAAFNAALEIKAEHVSALNGLAWLYWDIDRSEEALELFKMSAGIRPTASSYGGIANLERRLNESYEAALEAIDIALVLAPDYQFGLREKGWILLEMGRSEASRLAFQQAVDRDPEDTNALFGLQLYAEGVDDFEGALVYANLVVDYAPEWSVAYIRRALVLRRLDRFRQAIKDADRAIELDPSESRGYTERAYALWNLGQTGDALESYEAGIAAGVASNELHYWYADALSDLGRNEEALQQVDLAMALPGASADDAALKAFIALELEEYAMARDAASFALGQDPREPYAKYYLARVELVEGNLDQALTVFDQAMNDGLPEDFVGYFSRDLVAAGHIRAALKLRSRYSEK